MHPTPTTGNRALSLHDALPISGKALAAATYAIAAIALNGTVAVVAGSIESGFNPLQSLSGTIVSRSEEHTSELQSRRELVCRLLLEKKKGDRAGAVERSSGDGE